MTTDNVLPLPGLSLEAPEAFKAYPKTPRLYKDCVITEKIDGTNGCVVVLEQPYIAPRGPEVLGVGASVKSNMVLAVYAQSRNRLITPDSDNYGFAKWVKDNAGVLAELLGPGRHYGEWYGRGIQRGYGLQERRFALFNPMTMDVWDECERTWADELNLESVRVLHDGPFSDGAVRDAMNELTDHGTFHGKGEAEGVVVYHKASRQTFKVTFSGDDHKALQEVAA